MLQEVSLITATGAKLELLNGRKKVLYAAIICLHAITESSENTSNLLLIFLDYLQLLITYSKSRCLTPQERVKGLEELYALSPWNYGYEVRVMLVTLARQTYEYPDSLATLLQVKAVCEKEFTLSWELNRPKARESHLKEEVDNILVDILQNPSIGSIATRLLTAKLTESVPLARSWALRTLKNLDGD